MADTQQSPGLLANILAVAGFFILIVIIVWGAYHLLRLTGNGVSSLFSRFRGNDSAITITVPSSPVASSRAFTLSWKHEAKENGSYALLYQCKQGLRIDAASPAGPATQIPCGNAFTLGTGTSVSLIPQLSATSSTEVPLTVIFMPSATTTVSADRPQGTATVTVLPGNGTSTQNTGSTNTGNTGNTSNGNTGSNTTTPKPTAPGVPDLSVRVLAVGVVDAWGNFVERQPMHQDEVVAVKFDISNNGTASTGNWYFTVQLPMQQAYTYASPIQMNLTPGSHIENVLRFKPINSGGGMITVTVDSTYAVRESNEGNNTAGMYANASNWPYQYTQPYVY